MLEELGGSPVAPLPAAATEAMEPAAAAALTALPLAARRLPSMSDTPRPSPPEVVEAAACAPILDCAPNPGHIRFGSAVAGALGSAEGEVAPETAPHALRGA